MSKCARELISSPVKPGTHTLGGEHDPNRVGSFTDENTAQQLGLSDCSLAKLGWPRLPSSRHGALNLMLIGEIIWAPATLARLMERRGGSI